VGFVAHVLEHDLTTGLYLDGSRFEPLVRHVHDDAAAIILVGERLTHEGERCDAQKDA
jgi:hypothetical protein